MVRRKQWLLELLSACILLIITSARVIKDVTNETPVAEGTCFYNGSWYEEGTELPTRGLCLICHCFKGFTEPNAFTCSVIDCPWEDYHQRFPGCTPIYADRDCCPIGWECDQRVFKDLDCDCEWRYLKHYDAKGCRPVYAEKKPWRENRAKNKPKDCPCPWRFDCSMTDDDSIEERACIFKKQVHPIGTKINTTNPCESCSCVADYFTQAPTISCLTVECPSIYSKTPLPEGCHYVYTEGQCCPIAVECPTVQENIPEKTLYNVPICEYKGKMYYEGEQIYPDEDPCLICLCTPQWTGINSTSCRQHDCMLERDARKLKQGCIPIYHEKTCCPIDYHCADEDFGFARTANKGPSFKSEDDEDEMCSFEGRYYPIGHVLDIKHPTNCVTCTCKTPPDFTCIHSSCPPPPNNDYNNCKAVYKPHSCCPDYTCEQKSARGCPDPICQGTNCWLVKREEDGCSICRCKSRCMPCPDMCQPENPDNECSGCICQINTTALITMEDSITETEKSEGTEDVKLDLGKCSAIKCPSGERCMLSKQSCNDTDCEPTPSCEKIVFGCVKEECYPECEEIGRYDDKCAICHCKNKTQDLEYDLKCPKPVCAENCILKGRDDNNCPICKCPTIDSDDMSCPLSQCRGYNCSLAVSEVGCVECTCQLPCKPKECPSGCDLDLDAVEGDGLLCGCHCQNSSTAIDLIYSKQIDEKCPDVSCKGYNCSVSSDSNGCPICSCKEECEILKCLDGCRLENETDDGRCPTCVCKLSRSARDNTQKECPPPTCLGYNCSVITGDDGCQQCLCESPCEETPQCPSHCKLEVTAPEGRCRACICSDNSEKSTEKTDVPPLPPKLLNGGIPGENSEPEKRENWDADFIPLPDTDIVPEVDNIYLLKDKDKKPEHVGDGHAYPVFGEKLESGFYMAEDTLTELSHDLKESDKNVDGSDDSAAEMKGFGDDYTMEEKGLESDGKCQHKSCPPGQKCVTRRLQCIRHPCPMIPVCIDVEPRCPIPSCAIGCMVMKWDDEVCPSCFCGIIRGAEGRVCPRTPCSGDRCYNVIGDDGCPKCKCDSICIPPECGEGCWLETETSGGQCPKCNCPRRRTTTTISSISFGTTPTTEQPTNSATESQAITTILTSTSEAESNSSPSSIQEMTSIGSSEEELVDARAAPTSTHMAETSKAHLITTHPTITDTSTPATFTKQTFQTITSTSQDSVSELYNTYIPENFNERTTITVKLPTTVESINPTTMKIAEIQKSKADEVNNDSDFANRNLSSSGSDTGFPDFPHPFGTSTTRKPSFVRTPSPSPPPPPAPSRFRKPQPQITSVRTTTGTLSSFVSSNSNSRSNLTINLENTQSTPKPCRSKMTTSEIVTISPIHTLDIETESLVNVDKLENQHQSSEPEKSTIMLQKPTTKRDLTTENPLQTTTKPHPFVQHLSTHTGSNSHSDHISSSEETEESQHSNNLNSRPQSQASLATQQNSFSIAHSQSAQTQNQNAPFPSSNPFIADDIVSALQEADSAHYQLPPSINSHQVTNNHKPFNTQPQHINENISQTDPMSLNSQDSSQEMNAAGQQQSSSQMSLLNQAFPVLNEQAYQTFQQPPIPSISLSTQDYKPNSVSEVQYADHQNAQNQAHSTPTEDALHSPINTHSLNGPSVNINQPYNSQSQQTYHVLSSSSNNNIGNLHQQQPSSPFQQSYPHSLNSNPEQLPPVITTFNQHQPSINNSPRPQPIQSFQSHNVGVINNIQSQQTSSQQQTHGSQQSVSQASNNHNIYGLEFQQQAQYTQQGSQQVQHSAHAHPQQPSQFNQQQSPQIPQQLSPQIQQLQSPQTHQHLQSPQTQQFLSPQNQQFQSPQGQQFQSAHNQQLQTPQNQPLQAQQLSSSQSQQLQSPQTQQFQSPQIQQFQSPQTQQLQSPQTHQLHSPQTQQLQPLQNQPLQSHQTQQHPSAQSQQLQSPQTQQFQSPQIQQFQSPQTQQLQSPQTQQMQSPQTQQLQPPQTPPYQSSQAQQLQSPQLQQLQSPQIQEQQSSQNQPQQSSHVAQQNNYNSVSSQINQPVYQQNHNFQSYRPQFSQSSSISSQHMSQIYPQQPTVSQQNSQTQVSSSLQQPLASSNFQQQAGSSLSSRPDQISSSSQQTNYEAPFNIQQQQQQPQAQQTAHLQPQISSPYQNQPMLSTQPVRQTISQLQQNPNVQSVSSGQIQPQISNHQTLYQPQSQHPYHPQNLQPQFSDSAIRPNLQSDSPSSQIHHQNQDYYQQAQQSTGAQIIQPIHQTFPQTQQANSAYPLMEQQHVFSIQNMQADPHTSSHTYQQPNYGPEILQLNPVQHNEPTHQESTPISQQRPHVHQQYVPTSQQSHHGYIPNAGLPSYQVPVPVSSHDRPYLPNSQTQGTGSHRPVFENTQNVLLAQQISGNQKPLGSSSTQQHHSHEPSEHQQHFASAQHAVPEKVPMQPAQQNYQVPRPTHTQQSLSATQHIQGTQSSAEVPQNNESLSKDGINQIYVQESQINNDEQYVHGTSPEEQTDAPIEHDSSQEDLSHFQANDESLESTGHMSVIEKVSDKPVIQETSPKPQRVPIVNLKGRPRPHVPHIHPLLQANKKPGHQQTITQTIESIHQEDISNKNNVQNMEQITEEPIEQITDEVYQNEENYFESLSQEKIHQDKENQKPENEFASPIRPISIPETEIATEDQSPIYYYDDDIEHPHDNQQYEDDLSAYEQQSYSTEQTTPSPSTTTTPIPTTQKRKTIRFTFSRRSPKPTQAMKRTTTTTTTPMPPKIPDSIFQQQWFINYLRDKTSTTTLHPSLQQHYQQHQHQYHQQQQQQQHNKEQYNLSPDPQEQMVPEFVHRGSSSEMPPVQQQDQQQQVEHHNVPTPSEHEQHQNEEYHTFHNHINQNSSPSVTQEIIDPIPQYQKPSTTPTFITQQQELGSVSAANDTASESSIYFSTVSSANSYGVNKFTADPLDSAFPCPTPHCNGYNCSLLRGKDGCQKCVCDSPCAPCPQHCVKTKTLADGRCPICDCTGPDPQRPVLSSGGQRCSPVECFGKNCRKVKDANGCPTCVCDPECVTPKCDPGCEILTDVPDGQCPGCVCKVTVVQAVVQKRPCPSVSCLSLNCKEVRGEDGCMKCICDPNCPAPKCDPGCFIQSGVAAGQCPTCVCSEYADDDDEEEDEAYCPNLFCADYGCREIPGPAGCPICLCDPLCKKPVCESGCEIVTNKYLGRCPVCICRSPIEVASPSHNVNNATAIKGVHDFVQDHGPIMMQENDPVYTTVSLGVHQEQEPHQLYDQQEQQEQLEVHAQHMLDYSSEEPTTELPTTTPAPTCAPSVCKGLKCETKTDENGCEVCTCRYPCPNPKCVGQCYPETKHPPHRCPGCVCPSRRKPPAN